MPYAISLITHELPLQKSELSHQNAVETVTALSSITLPKTVLVVTASTATPGKTFPQIFVAGHECIAR